MMTMIANLPAWEKLLIVLGAIGALHQRIGEALKWLSGLVITRKRVDADLGALITSYLNANWKLVGEPQIYGSMHKFVKPVDRTIRVAFRFLVGGIAYYRNGRQFICHATVSERWFDISNDFRLMFSYLRGTIDWEKLVIAALDWEESLRQENSHAVRFAIVQHEGKPEGMSGGGGDNKLMPSLSNRGDHSKNFGNVSRHFLPNSTTHGDGIIPLRWDIEHLKNNNILVTLDDLALTKDQLRVVDEIKFFMSSKQWYQQHNVPWRRGWTFRGPHGTGKTSFTRALGEHFDLPIHTFDLATMTNSNLRSSWKQMTRDTPCIALLEDIDAVFEGRKNITNKQDGVSFNGLLNVIDGIERVDGVLLVITTNFFDKLDKALTDRPGRVDRVIDFHALSHEGRLKIAQRIIGDHTVAVKLAMESEDMSATDFQEKCTTLAITARYSAIG